jgi:hypothetical protein
MLPPPIERHPVVRIRQILRRQPEVHRVLGHQVERPPGRDRGCPAPQGVGVELADERDVPHRVLPLRRPEVEVVQAKRLLEDGRVRAAGDGHQDRVHVAHVVPPDHVGAVGEPARMPVAGRPQQQRRRVDRACRHHHHVRRVGFDRVAPLHHESRHLAAGRAGLELRDVGVGQQRHVRIREGRVDRDHLRVGLGPHQARVAVAGLAADAATAPRVALVEHDAERDVEGAQAEPGPVVVQLLEAGLVAHGRMRVRRARGGIRRVHPPLAVHVVEALRRGVVGLHVLVAYGPRRRYPTPVLDLAEVLPAEPEERGPVELGVATHVVVGVRVERLTVAVAPGLLGLVAPLEVHRPRAPVGLLARHVVAALEDQDALAPPRQGVEQRAAPRPGADDRDVVVHGPIRRARTRDRGSSPRPRRSSAR